MATPTVAIPTMATHIMAEGGGTRAALRAVPILTYSHMRKGGGRGGGGGEVDNIEYRYILDSKCKDT